MGWPPLQIRETSRILFYRAQDRASTRMENNGSPRSRQVSRKEKILSTQRSPFSLELPRGGQ